jgi:hypothetical protein
MAYYRDTAGNYRTSSATQEVVEHGVISMRMEPTTVATDTATKQALLTAVPTGRVRIVTRVVVRNASASLAEMADALSIGFNALATDVGSFASDELAALTTSAQAAVIDVGGGPGDSGNVVAVGVAGQILGCIFADVAIEATADIDVTYYDVDA